MAAAASNAPVVIWQPRSRPQYALLSCPVFEIFFGGARGSLKTDGMLGEWAVHADAHGKHAIGLMVRRERIQLMETIERSKEIYQPLGASYNEQDKVWRFKNGARLRFAHLERDADAEAYQGHSYTRVYIEELTNFPSPAPVMKLKATLRSAHGVRVGFRATGNPGGPGHAWVKARYIDPAPLGWKIINEEYANPWTRETVIRDRVFIPGRITDHNLLGPEYIANLQASGSAELVRAWLEGDWNVVQGAFFGEFGATRHIVGPSALPQHWVRFRGFDWGYARPFSVGWYAVSDGTVQGFAKGALVRYREWYGCNGEPNVGLRLDAEAVAAGIRERTPKGESINYSVADPSIFAEQDGPSIAERMHKAGVTFMRGENARVRQVGAMGGWDQVRARLRGDEDGPGLILFSTCTHLIRTLPLMQHDPDRPEDMNTEAEDHAVDELRYACMSRPYSRTIVTPAEQRTLQVGAASTATMDDMWAEQERKMQEQDA